MLQRFPVWRIVRIARTLVMEETLGDQLTREEAEVVRYCTSELLETVPELP